MERTAIKDTRQKITNIVTNLEIVLHEKNKRYGDSACSPLEVFTGKTTPLGLGVRIDDKLSRVKNSESLRKNDVFDLMGYLVLLCAANNWTDFSEFID